MVVELEFRCDVCNRPVADKAGCILVRYEDLSEWHHQDDEWKAEHPGPTYTAAEIYTRPDPAPWRIQHDACADDGVQGYEINVDEVRTWQALLCWTAKLMDRTWLPLTDWHLFVGQAASGHGERIIPARGDAA